MKNLLLRTLTGLAYVIVITVGILTHSLTFLALFSAVTLFCLWEFYSLINARKRTQINRWYNALGGLILFVSSYLYASGVTSHVIFLAYLAYIVLVFVLELYEKQPDPITHSAGIFLGQCYIALPLSLVNRLVFPLSGAAATGQYDPLLILALMVFIWTNDTGAYLVGSLFGKHRLFERISPKKSWEGFFGGILLAVAVSFLFARFEPDIPSYHWAGLAFIVSIFATWGDLAESLIKRTLDVKDSGKTLPGHGGFLDRFDSLLLAVYAMLFYTQLFVLR
jgi:phosphatidate cytidylyltransferase